MKKDIYYVSAKSIPKAPRNDTRFEAHGWYLVGDGAYFDYQSYLPNPNRWIVQSAVHDDGREGLVVWYYTDEAERLSDRTNDSADWVSDWSKCYGVICLD